MRETLPVLLLLMTLCAFHAGCGGCGEEQAAVTAGSEVRFVVDEQLRGLQVRLADAVPPPVTEEPAKLVEGEPLTEQQVERLLRQLPPLSRDDAPGLDLPIGPEPPAVAGELPAFPPAPSASPDTGDAKPLTVVRRGPQGDVDHVPGVAVTFSRPMVELDDPGKVPVRIEPEPPGRWRWVGDRSAVFEPAGLLPRASEFQVEVPRGVKSLDGAVLAEPHVFDLATPTPVLRDKIPLGGPHPLQPVIFLGFDQRIDASSMARHVALVADDGEEFTLRLASADEVRADPEVHRLAVRAEEGCWLALRPRDPLARGTDFRVVVRAGAPSAEGPRPTPRDQSFSFATFGPLQVEDARCGWGAGCTPADPWIVRLSNAIDPTSFELADVRVEPPQPGLQLQVWEDSISLEGVKRGRTRYELVLPDGLRDVFGQTLATGDPIAFEVAPAGQRLVGPDTDLLVIAPGESTIVPVQSVDHDRLRVRIHRVDPSHWAAWQTWREPTAFGAPPAGSMPGKRLCDHVLVVEGAPGRQTETVVDLGPYLQDSRGQFAVAVEPAGKRLGAPLSFWVQVTDLALASFADEQDLTVWITSLSTGEPIAGAEIALVPGEPVVTDADGLASLPLPAIARSLVVARTRGDAARLPRQEGWGRVSRADRMVWYTTDLQGTYLPGERVRIKGWLRREGSGSEGDIGEMTPSPARVAWSLRGATGRDRGQGVVPVGPLGGFDVTLSLPVDMASGDALLRLYAVGVRSLDGTEHEHGFAVVRPTGREPELDVQSGPHRLGEEVVLGLTTSPSLPGAEVRWAVESIPTAFVPAGREAFQFGPEMVIEEGSHDHVELFDGRTDAAGRHHLGVHFESIQPPQPARVRVEAMAGPCDPAMTSFVVHPSDLYLGLRSDRSFVPADEPIDVAVVAVDIDGEAVPRTEVSVELSRITTEPVEADVCRVTTGDEPSVCTFRPATAGSYRVVARAADDEGRPCETEMRLRVAGASDGDETLRSPELVGPTGVARPGEDTEVLLRAHAYPSTGLLTLRRTGLVESRPLRVVGPVDVLRVSVEERHVPNLDLQVDLTGPDGERARDRLSLPIDAGSRALDLVLLPREAAVAPGAETVLNLSVTDAEGRPALGAELFVVAVPDHSGHRLAHPLDVLYASRADEVAERWLREPLPAPDGVGPGHGRAAGAGSGHSVPDPPVHAPGFVVAESVFSDASGTASVPLRVPAASGEYRVMAVAASGGQRFGYGEARVTVRAPLTVAPGAPRFVRLGDRVELPVVLHNRGPDALTVEVAVRVGGAALGRTADLADEDLPDTGGVRVTVQGRERVQVRLPFAPTAPGIVPVQVIAASGSFVERAELDVPVLLDEEHATATGRVGDEPLGMEIGLPSEIWPQVGGVDVVTSASARLLLSDALWGLLTREGAGTEPLASAILGLAPQRDALSSLAGPVSAEEMEERVALDLGRLLALQNPDGGFPLWRAGGESHPFASVHAAHALARAHDHQYDVPWRAWTAALQYLGQIEGVLAGMDDPAAEASLGAYALFARAWMGDVDLRSARHALDEPRVQVLPAEACAWLLPVLLAGGDRGAAAQLAQQLESRASSAGEGPRFTDAYERPGELLYSAGREDGIVLDALLQAAPDSALVEPMAREMLDAQMAGRTPGFLSGCFSLLALDGYLDRTEPARGGPMSRIWVGRAFAGERLLGGAAAHRIAFPMESLIGADDAVPLVIQRQGSGPLYHHVHLRLAPGRPRADGHGVAVGRHLEAVDDPRDVRQDRDGTWLVRAGARIRIVVTVVPRQPLEHVAVTSPAPGGTAPAFTDALAARWYDHEVIDDDRAQAYATQLPGELVRYSHVVLASVPGDYGWPPARAKARYDRHVHGDTAVGRVVIE